MAGDATTTRTDSQAAGGARPVSAVILAAGKGTRMNSDLPKVCHPVGGRPMVCAVVDACLRAGVRHIVVVVGYKQELVREALAGYVATVVTPASGSAAGSASGADESRGPLRLEFAVQSEQLGTGHAVMSAEAAFAGQALAGRGRDVLVLCGDGPLIRDETIQRMLHRHRETRAAATLATSVIDDPTGYGRIVRDASGAFQRIVEQKNASEAERAIREVNPSYYCFDGAALFGALRQVGRNPLTGEYYITDVFELLRADGRRVEVIDAVPPEDVLSINTPEHLAEVDRIFRSRAMRGRTGIGAGTRPGGHHG
ncbi:MAG: NTP transferase domain-containing protein [Phycisphaeraceae bacterium]|nr:NTP transferase domain-containing protein [Phycisphaeraceae bacterium]